METQQPTRPSRPSTRGVLAAVRDGRRRRRLVRAERRRAERDVATSRTGAEQGDLLAAMHAGDDVSLRAVRAVARQVEQDRGPA